MRFTSSPWLVSYEISLFRFMFFLNIIRAFDSRSVRKFQSILSLSLMFYGSLFFFGNSVYGNYIMLSDAPTPYHFT